MSAVTDAVLRSREARQSAGLRCEILTDFSRLQELSDEWQGWVAQDPRTDVFQQWTWVRAFCRAYGRSTSLRAAAVYHRNRAIGILPLVERRRTLEFLGTPESDYNDLICEKGAEVRVLETALETLLSPGAAGDWDSIVLDNLPAYSRIVSCLGELRPSLRKRLQLLARCQSPTVLLTGDKARVLETLVGKDQLKRYDRRLRKTGRVTFRHIESREEARRQLAPFFRQHMNRCAMSGVRSQFLTAERRAFYEALVEECDLRSLVRFAVLELDGRPVAYHFGLQCNGKFTWYKPAFDVDYWDYSPGDVLLRNLFQYAGEPGIAEFDFSVGDEPFKFRFANHRKQNFVVYIERNPAQLRSQVNRTVHFAVAAARREPAVRHLFKKAAGLASEVQARIRARHGFGSLRVRLRDGVCRAFGRKEEVLFFAMPAGAVQRATSAQVSPASMSALAALATESPGSLGAAHLHDFRRRLKQGDRAFIARGHRGGAAILWVGRRDSIAVPEISPECRLVLPEPALVLYERWSGLADGSAPADYLRGLAACCAGDELWTYCLRRQTSLQHAIIDAGLEIRRRLTHRALLGRFRRVTVLPCGAHDREMVHACS